MPAGLVVIARTVRGAKIINNTIVRTAIFFIPRKFPTRQMPIRPPVIILDAVFFHLGRAEMFREFREGDVSLERWEDPFSLRTILRRTLRFLYY